MFRFLKAACIHIFFLKASPLVRKGKHKIIELDDMPELPPSLEPQHFSQSFLALPSHSPWAFLKGCLAAQKRRMLIIIAWALSMLTLELLSPLLIYQLITYVARATAATTSLAEGLGIALLLVTTSTLQALAMQHYFYQVLLSTQEATNGLNFLIYRKALGLTRHARLQRPTGDIVNYMGTDAEAVAQFAWVVVDLGYCLAIIVGAGLLLFNFLGMAALAAFAVLLLLSPLTKILGQRFIRIDDRLLLLRDKRVSLISQLITGIRVIKYFTWEAKAIDDITMARSQELHAKRKLVIAESYSILLYICTNTLLAFAAFSTYLWLGNELEAAIIFASIALFAAMEHPFGNLTDLISKVANGRVGAERIIRFLAEDAVAAALAPTPANSAYGVHLQGLTARYEDAELPALKGIDLEVRAGECVAIVGPVGCGKSSLLLALLNEVPITEGHYRLSPSPAPYGPRIAWVPQEAFICNRSVRDNILFGEDKQELLAEAISLCCLSSDLQQMANGLDTEIGEQGINLSGGQKQRLALARAYIYQAGLLLLDDPVSAVDEETETQLFTNLITGAWSQTTRIMVTHRLAHLAAFDRVVYMEHGEIVAVGSFASLLQTSPPFATFYQEYAHHSPAPSSLQLPTAALLSSELCPLASSDTQACGKPEEGPFVATGQRFIIDEDRVRGHISSKVFLSYLQAMGGQHWLGRPLIIAALLLSSLCVAFLPVAQNAWLALWSNGHRDQLSHLETMLAPFLGDNFTNMLLYSAIGLLLLLAYFAQHLLWAFRSLAASKKLHASAFTGVLRTRVRFFDTNPTGRILNRFSMDVDAIEKQLPTSFEQMIRSAMNVLVSLTVLISVLPVMVLVIIPTLAIYYRLQNSFRRVSREVKRLSSLTRSPRFAHFKETLEGLAVIRHLHKSDLFLAGFYTSLHNYQRAFYGMILLNRWFSIRIPLLSSLIAAAVTLALIIAARQGLVASGTAGLVLLYSLQLWGNLNWCIRAFSEAESRLISIERLRYFSLLPGEEHSKASLASDEELAQWPQSGEIEFSGVSVRYSQKLPFVLRDVSFTINSGEKVGLIGRTGAGKSTLLQILFRFLPVSQGGIYIAGININTIPLAQLRSHISIIPQEPTLFAGSLRKNLDWLGAYRDEEIWQAIQRAHLFPLVGSRQGLGMTIKENGENLSQGQRQLVCLARALLVASPIIVIDEATASVDVATDQLIQRTINEECKGKTIVIIAHRLATLSDCDRVIEMADGRVKSVWAAQEIVARAGTAALLCPPSSREHTPLI